MTMSQTLLKNHFLGDNHNVTCIDNEEFESHLTLGKVYPVKEVWHAGWTYLIENDKGRDHTYWATKFQTIKAT